MTFEEDKAKALATMHEDKSPKGSVDEPIRALLDVINEKENYYTLSSCSGRISIATDYNGAKGITWLHVTHELLRIEDLNDAMIQKQNGLVWLRQEDIILHIGAKTVEDALALVELAQQNGYKHTGILQGKKRFVVELRGERRMDVPIAKDGHALVNQDYLLLLCNRANQHLDKAHEGIARLHKALLKL